MIKVGLVGGRGYVGAELIGLLDKHPDFQVVFAGSDSLAGQNVSTEIERELNADLKFQALDPSLMRSLDVDVWVLAQPNGKAAEWVEHLNNAQTRFVDISADFRFDSHWIYGLPELSRDSIKGSERVANPGCYATAAQLALLPVRELIGGRPVIFGISGYSGAGKKPSEKNDAARLADNILPYSLVSHGHEREVSHHMGRCVSLIPHVAQFFRGISVTAHIPFAQSQRAADVNELYRDAYHDEPFIKIQEGIPEINDVRNSNNCHIGGFALSEDGRQLVVVSVIDNLLKGAASQAVQNLNLMFGFDERTGLGD